MNSSDWLARLPSPFASATPGEPRQWYRIRAEATAGEDVVDEASVYIYGVIGGWWSGVDAATFVSEIRDIKAKTLRVHINSVGGSVYDGNAIFQALRNHPARIVTCADSLAASAASIVLMAGDQRECAPYAEIMVHKAWGVAIGDDETMEKARDDLARVSRNMAKVYTNRSTSDATAEEWLEVMKAETWYSADDAVEAGLVHVVQEDAEKTGDDAPDDTGAEAMNRYALEFFGRPDRAAMLGQHPPSRATRCEPTPEPGPPADPADPAAQAAPEVSGAEPEPDNRTEEDILSTDLSDISSRLGLTDDEPDQVAILAAIDELKAKADTPTEPTPDPEALAEAERMAALNEDLSAKVAMLAEQVQAMGSQLAAVNAEKAAATKASVIQAAADKGKFTPAERATWEARYDRAPEVTTEVLATIPDFTAVPLALVGETGPDEASGEAFNDHEYDRLFGEKVGA